MTHRACRSRARTGHLTATGPVTPTRSRDRWGRAETQRTALGEALVIRRRTRVRFPPPPPWVLPESLGSISRNQAWKNPRLNHVGPGLTTGPHVRPGCASRSARWVMVRVEGGPGDSAGAGCPGAADGRDEGGPRNRPGEVGGRVGDVDQIGAGLGGSCDRDDVVPAPAAGTDASAQGAVGVQSRA